MIDKNKLYLTILFSLLLFIFSGVNLEYHYDNVVDLVMFNVILQSASVIIITSSLVKILKLKGEQIMNIVISIIGLAIFCTGVFNFSIYHTGSILKIMGPKPYYYLIITGLSLMSIGITLYRSKFRSKL